MYISNDEGVPMAGGNRDTEMLRVLLCSLTQCGSMAMDGKFLADQGVAIGLGRVAPSSWDLLLCHSMGLFVARRVTSSFKIN